MPQIRLQQKNRAHRLVALVPQAGARSELDSSSDSSTDEMHVYIPAPHSDSSSLPPSLPPFLENLHLLLDSDHETTDIFERNDVLKPSQRPLLSMASLQQSPLPNQVTLPVQLHSDPPTTKQTGNLPEQANANASTLSHLIIVLCSYFTGTSFPIQYSFPCNSYSIKKIENCGCDNKEASQIETAHTILEMSAIYRTSTSRK